MSDNACGAYQRHEKRDIDRDEREHIGPEGEIDWHGMYLDENRRAEKAERERDRLHAQVLAALTPPPPRPEGAHELETVIGLNAGKWTNGADDVRALADLLAENGVRVVGGQS